MPISFDAIPVNIRVPLYYVEVDPSMAGLPTIRNPALIVGTMIDATGNGVPDVPIPIGTQAQADDQFGQGSELALSLKTFFANNFAHETWALPMAEPGGGTAATGTVTVTTPQTEAGTIHLYIAGKHVGINIAADDTTDEVASAIATAINLDKYLPVTATPSTNVVNLVCNWKGTSGNDISVYLNYHGGLGQEQTPVGLVLTLPGTYRLTGGAGVPDFTQAIVNLGEQEFEYVSLPYTDSTTLLGWETEYGFSDAGRWGWARQHFGHIFSAKRDTYANLIAWGATQNSGITSVLAIETKSPSPLYEWTAAYTGKAARSLTNDPARPLQTLQLNTILMAPGHDRFNLDELNTLAGAGLATQKAGSSGYPMISRESTTYQLNLYGFGDDAYELVTTLATLAKLIRNQRHAITSKYPRHKLANDGTRFGVGQKIVTPKIIKAELVSEYRIDEYNGLVEDVKNFKKHLIVERDPNNPNRLNVLYPPDLVNQLRIFAVLAQFRLQYDRGVDAEIEA